MSSSPVKNAAGVRIPSTYKTPARLTDPDVGKDSIWVEFVGLTNKHKALNLGQGFPNFFPPAHVIDNLTRNGDKYLLNQYTRGPGHPPLVQALKHMYDPLLKREIDAMKEVIVTVGAYGSLYCAIMASVSEGDEVIVVEPFFDCYAPMIKLAGGIPKFIQIKPPTDPSKANTTANWAIDMEELDSMFTSKTKLVIINNPNNPLGKVFTLPELTAVAEVIKKHDVMCISDEVYEHLIYPGVEMHRMATIDGMWDRTFTIGSAGKTFSVTGWKLGWCIAPAYLIKNMNYVWQNVVYTSPTPIQDACADSFMIELKKRDAGDKDCYFTALADELLPKRDEMAKLAESIGLKAIIPEGGYFMVADAKDMKVDIPKDFYDDSVPWDHNLARWLIHDKGISTIPNSAFYSPEGQKENNHYLRFCFAKDDATFKKTHEEFEKKF
jgi:kynurenine--oxoglutarate transaminase/cysteine-S-conjugate beta-lyase/glutamine--phenylpyruvate transaminase